MTRPPYPVIDVHAHIMPWDQIRPDASATMSKRPDFADVLAISSDPDRLIEYMDTCGVSHTVLINYLSPDVVGFTEETNAYSAKIASAYPDRLIPFGGIDPRRVPDVATEMDHLLAAPPTGLGLRGIKLHPPHQLFHVNEYTHNPELHGLATVYEKCVEYGVPVMVHTGTSIFPRARNKFGNPIDIDDLIIDFPKLKVIIAHGGRPLWMDTALFLLRRSRNIYLDISSIPPKNLLNFFPWIERVADQTMFGTDWPGPGVRDVAANIEAFYALPISEDSKRTILRETAVHLFELDAR